MGIPEGVAARLQKEAYGLIAAPPGAARQGLQQLRRGPCVWCLFGPDGQLHGVANARVDDFQFSGDHGDPI
eukprot:11224487-Lingulodinium_polyedra.AAC.1